MVRECANLERSVNPPLFSPPFGVLNGEEWTKFGKNRVSQMKCKAEKIKVA